MIVCKLMGGLGNQMFQYAYARALAEEQKDSLCFDISFYNGKTPTIFKFNLLQDDIVNEVELSDYSKAVKQEKIYRVLQKVIRILTRGERIGEKIFNHYVSKGYFFNFDPYYYTSKPCKKNNKYIYGYFQGEQYFNNVRNDIKNEFTLIGGISDTAKKYKEEIISANSVAIHIRLGDYTQKKNSYLYVCTDKYYEAAIEYVREHIDNPKFFIFTNDIESVKKKNYIPTEATYVSETKDYEDIMLMKECKHFVISNSTFSWWGAYLSDNEQKKVIVPEKWMTTTKEDPAIYLPEMIRILC